MPLRLQHKQMQGRRRGGESLIRIGFGQTAPALRLDEQDSAGQEPSQARGDPRH